MADFDRAIPPGGEGKITLHVDTKGLQGKITKNAVVRTNDPELPKTKITVSANVRPFILVTPGRKILLQGIVGDQIRKVLQIRSADDQPLKILDTNTNLGSLIDYELTPKKQGLEYVLEVTSKSSRRVTSSGFLTLITNHPKKKQLKLSVHIRVRPELEVFPNRLMFRETSKSGKRGRSTKRIVTVVNNRGKGFRLLELRHDTEYFSVSSTPPAGKIASRHRVKVTPLLERMPAGRVGVTDTLVIKTDVAEVGELRVPMNVRLEKG